MEDNYLRDLFDSFMYAVSRTPRHTPIGTADTRKNIPKIHLKSRNDEKSPCLNIDFDKLHIDHDLLSDIPAIPPPTNQSWQSGCDFGHGDSKTVYVWLNEKHEHDGICAVPGSEDGEERMNGKSLEFAKKRIASRECGGMENDKFEHMNEIDFHAIADNIQFNECVKVSDNVLEVEFLFKGPDKKVKLSIKHNPDAEFDYISAKRCCCDGTFCFFVDLCKDILEKILSGQSAYTPKIPKDIEESPESYDISFEVGNFVLAEEYGEQFATKEKPWMQCRFTAMLPVKCEFVRRDT